MTLASLIVNQVNMGTFVIINRLPLLPLSSFIHNHSFEATLVIESEYQKYPNPYHFISISHQGPFSHSILMTKVASNYEWL